MLETSVQQQKETLKLLECSPVVFSTHTHMTEGERVFTCTGIYCTGPHCRLDELHVKSLNIQSHQSCDRGMK